MASTFAGSYLAQDHFVAVDCETTGINPDRDVITEIAIVVFGREGIVERYSQYINPGRKLPLEIVRLTGITDEDLKDAPPIQDVRARVRELIGSLPVVGHNVDFDVAMMEKSGIPVPNLRLDTFRLAMMLMPNLGSYSLGSVAEALGVGEALAHRALPDAERAAGILQRLIERMGDYDERTLNQAAGYARQAGWPEATLFRQVADRMISGPLFNLDQSRELPPEIRFMEPRDYPKALQRTGSQTPLDIDGMLALLSPGGPLSHVLERFESRPTQVRMAGAVGRALNDSRELLVEAGTGTGKSLAYLLPAALFAIDRGERVVITTNTLALQDQLYRKDLPDLRAALHEHGVGEDLRVAVMKGRTNYLCLRRWFDHMNDPIEDAADASLRAKILLWLPHTETGDKAELRLNRDEERHWRKFASERGRCSPKRCPYAKSGQCFLYRARFNAANAHIVIANHSLVLSNSAQGFVLPAFERLIIDEAHHLEEEATSQFSWSVDRGAIDEPVKLLVNSETSAPGGFFAIASTFFLRAGDLTAAREAEEANRRASDAATTAASISALAGELMTRLGGLLPPSRGGRQSFSDQLRLTESVKYRGQWSELSLLWSQLDREVMSILDAGRWFLRILDAMSLPDDDTNPASATRDELTIDMQAALEPLTQIRSQLLAAFGTDDGRNVFWIERSPAQANISVNGAPLDVSELLRSEVFNDLKTCVLTSATLTIDGTFDYIAERLGLEDSVQLALGSPFDHRQSTLVYVPDDMPDPKHPAYQEAINRTLIDLLRATEGRALVLFTSHSSLRATLNSIKGPLARHNISVLGQGIDGSFRQLTDRLRTNPGTALLGTSSYWEGVDVVGEALSVVVIVKLPFPVPSEPVFEARCELSPDPFNELSVPRAVLKFKQGFGRLIRSSQDRGVCVVLDRRVISRRYGQSFLHSLPPSEVVFDSMHDLPYTAGRWLGVAVPASVAYSILGEDQW
ncbi:MAG: DEAD/DEAH box helicase family protein [Chloroflexia bacterium]|nr:DEAD/DEAH box helicase family protein [Chloroflexia bacterium]